MKNCLSTKLLQIFIDNSAFSVFIFSKSKNKNKNNSSNLSLSVKDRFENNALNSFKWVDSTTSLPKIKLFLLMEGCKTLSGRTP